MNDEAVKKRLEKIRHVALDLDGTIYKGNTLFDFTPDFMQKLDSLGIGYTFLTNNSSRSVREYLDKLHGLGLAATPDQVYTSSLATISYLRTDRPALQRLFIFGTPGLKLEFEQAGFTVVLENYRDEPNAVIVGFDTTMTYHRLCMAAYWIKQRKPFIATHPDLVCPTDQPTVMVDCGSICAALEKATGIAPDKVLGKPDPTMLKGILERHGLQPYELAMVGDRLNTDMAMARLSGAFGVLVLTGESTAQDAAAIPQSPDLILPSVKELGELLVESRNDKAL